MSKRFMSALLALSSVALAANEPVKEKRIDAFLSRRESRPLVDPRGLTSAGRAAFANGVVSSIEPRYGVPTFFWSSPRAGERSYRDMGLSPAQAARRYLLTHAELYRGETTRWAEAQISSLHDLGDGSAVIVTFQQRVDGVRVFRDELKVIMNAKLELVALSGYLTPQTRKLGDFSLSSQSAISSAYQQLIGRSLEGDELTQLGTFEGGYEHWRLTGSQTPVRARAVFFPLPEGVVPGFYVELDVPTSEQDSAYFSFVISAVDGSVLYEKNLTVADSYTYKVWADATAPFLPFDGPQGLSATPHPTGTPSNFDPGTATQNMVTLEHAGLSTLDPWLAPAATQTSGNNVRAYADIARSNGFTMGSDPIGTATSLNTFEYTYDFNVSPTATTSQRQAAITQLFYDNNLFHDWYYDDGFNEAAGNAQVANRGRGGLGNDVLLAEAQDYSGTSNANMSTPSDGASPRMQMYLFVGSDSASVVANTATPQPFNTLGADYGAQVFNVTAPLLLANDGSTTPTGTAASGTTSDACQALPAGFATGKILLVDRGGGCTFVSKAEKAQAAGALGVIIANNTSGGPVPLTDSSPSTTIPVMSVSFNSGTALKGIITSGGGATTVTLTRTASSDRDGTLDNGVVAHEWGHYISNRLIGDGNGISNLQAVGMGEGWADFHAGVMIARESDALVASNANWVGAFGLAGWAGFTTDSNAYYYGFRRYPLSVDFAKNPLTFKHISDGVRLPTTAPVAYGASGADNSEVHNTGEVWAAMLWECYVAMLRDNRRSFTQTQALMKRYLVGAYKATALMPTFIDARDAVLAVAVANDPADFAALWAAFARRGIGMGAIAPDRDSQDNTPVTESFTVGNAVTVTEVSLNDATTNCDNDGNLDANETGVLTIRLRNTGVGTLAAASVTVTSTTTGVTFPQGASATMASTPPFGVATVTFAVAMGDVAGSQGGMFNIVITDPSLAMGPITHQAMFRLNFDMVPNSSRLDDVESPMTTWTSSSDPNLNTGSNFRVFQSTATQHFWFGPNPASPADTFLTSPVLNVGAAPATITFKHRYDFERNATEFFDGAVLEVSTNGTTWTDVGASSTPGYTGTLTTSQNQSANPLRGKMAFVGKSVNYPTFNTETVDLGTRFANQAIRLRFRIGADDAAAAKGWEIDDILINGINNKPFTSVTSDPNTCTNGAPVATIGPNIEVNERESVTLVGSGTDPDGDTLTVNWTQLAGPTINIASGTFTAPNVDADTLITLQMTVTDGRAVTMPLEQTVLVKNVNRRPIATVPATIEANMGELVTVLGSGSDEDGEPLTFEWSQVSGPTAELSGATTNDVTFAAPAVAVSEVVKLQLIVRDRTEASDPAFVDVVVKNPNPMVVEPEMPKGCGCTTGFELLPLAMLGLLFRARRKRS
jgi:large repetitive protein